MRAPAARRSCRPPPNAQEDCAHWTLRGDKGMKNGERKLRTAITKRQEWREEGARGRSADAAAAAGNTELATALRCRDSSRLRKPHLFELCRLWRLRSDIWEPRAVATAPAAPRRRAAAPQPDASGASAACDAGMQLACAPAPGSLAAQLASQLAAASQPSFDCHPLVSAGLKRDAVTVFLIAELDACVEQHRVWSLLPGLREAAAHEPHSPLNLLAPAHFIAALMPSLRWFEASLRADGAAIRAFGAQLAMRSAGALCAGLCDADADLNAPAWRATAALPPLAERAAHALLQVLHVCAATLADTQAALAARRAAGGTFDVPCATDRAYVADIERSLDAIAAFVQRAQSALAQLRHGAAGPYLEAAASVCERGARIVATMASVAASRAAWHAQRGASLGLASGPASSGEGGASPASSGSHVSGGGGGALATRAPPHLARFMDRVVAARLLPDEARLLAPMAPFVAVARAEEAAHAGYTCLRVAGPLQ